MTQPANTRIRTNTNTSVWNFHTTKPRNEQPESLPAFIPSDKTGLDADQLKVARLTKWFSQVGFLNGLQYSLLPATEHNTKNRLVLKFTLANGFASNFILLKSLFDFGRFNGVTISSDKSEGTFTVQIAPEQAEQSVPYFEKIFSWFNKEVVFKATLKKAIDLEARIRKEQADVYGSLTAAFQ